MNKRNKRRIFCIMMIALALSVSACKQPNKKQDNDSSVTNSMENTIDNTLDTQSNNDEKDTKSQDSVVNAINDTTEETDTEVVEAVATKEISIYTMNESTLEVEMVTALIPAESEITPQLIVDLVADSLADRLVTVGLEPVTTEGDAVVVSFLSDQPPLTNVGGGLEDTILSAFARSLVDNLKDKYPKVIFREEGRAYSSGHFEFELNEVYLDGTMTN